VCGRAAGIGQGLLDEQRVGRGDDEVVSRAAALDFPVKPGGAERGFAALGAGQDENEPFQACPRLMLTGMEIEAEFLSGVISHTTSQNGG